MAEYDAVHGSVELDEFVQQIESRAPIRSTRVHAYLADQLIGYLLCC